MSASERKNIQTRHLEAEETEPWTLNCEETVSTAANHLRCVSTHKDPVNHLPPLVKRRQISHCLFLFFPFPLEGK